MGWIRWECNLIQVRRDGLLGGTMLQPRELAALALAATTSTLATLTLVPQF